MNVAIIPARAGSTRIPGKNKKLFHGKPIVQYSIEAAKSQRSMFQLVVVSTDDPEIAAIATSLNVTVHDRSVESARNEVGTQEVGAEVLRWICRTWAVPQAACVIYATAPLMSPVDLWRGLEQVIDRGRDFAFSVGTEPLRDAGQWYWGKTSAFVGRKHLIGTNTAMVPIEEDRVCDINTPEDWARAERMWEAKCMKGCPA